ncbi:2-hydroxychromene-2-carboxylate isomerase [Inmirania thermothiophila]|uniref:2-hydroxychromene-2-carboxylate isomerase n=1 Tax=Inmirania thermothiophila TaxID=1750597 RepID=A0A3N1Y0S2_9GAMM|nr:2-hydroxychromene-2-carboxylate isomerase [Inmirania thermothiophila]ROR32434.1 2-hydroxychromene-2-carboxylate isomerase [Inmirania thermothiophila]
MAAPVEFWFDFYSPYGYLASLQIDEIAARHGRATVWRPFLLGPIFQRQGLAPLVEIPLLGDYARHDFARSARLIGAPFRLPSAFPKAGLAPARAFYWLAERDEAKARALARAVFRAVFVEDRDGADPAVVAELAAPLGIERDELLAAVARPEIKERVKAATAEAMARGVCGSPFFFVDGEPFWGNDRLWQVERWLETGGW